MKTVRFRTRISKSGTIQIPNDLLLTNKEVEVIILPRKRQVRKKMKAGEFVTKWAGALFYSQSEDLKYDYLMGKHK